jgi:hypothetical protein
MLNANFKWPHSFNIHHLQLNIINYGKDHQVWIDTNESSKN